MSFHFKAVSKEKTQKVFPVHLTIKNFYGTLNTDRIRTFVIATPCANIAECTLIIAKALVKMNYAKCQMFERVTWFPWLKLINFRFYFDKLEQTCLSVNLPLTGGFLAWFLKPEAATLAFFWARWRSLTKNYGNKSRLELPVTCSKRDPSVLKRWPRELLILPMDQKNHSLWHYFRISEVSLIEELKKKLSSWKADVRRIILVECSDHFIVQ